MLVLVVDDSKLMRKSVSKMLDTLGHGCIEAEHGKECLERLQEVLPDLILLDWNMPELNGIETLKTIRSDQKYDQVKVVMMTTENAPDKIQLALDTGANEYIMKMFDVDLLKGKIDELEDDFL